MGNYRDGDGVWVGPVKYPIWRDRTEVTRYPGGFSIIANPDIEKIKASLIETLVAKDAVQRAEAPLKSLAEGGMKVRDLDTLGSPCSSC